MTDNMQRARELLAAEYEKHGRSFTARTILSNPERVGEDFNRALRAIAAALRLAVPEGMVMVPREPTESMVEAICAAHAAGGWPDGYGKHAQGLHRAHAQIGYRAMLAAAPKPEDS